MNLSLAIGNGIFEVISYNLSTVVMATLDGLASPEVVMPNTTTSDTEPEEEEIIGVKLTRLIMKILMFGVTPGIAVLGIVGNTLSIMILLKHGLHKCSNILLVSLAVADIVFLVAYNSIPKIIYETSSVRGFDGFSERDSIILNVFYSIFMSLDFSSSMVSLTMPMLITLERLIVIFFPLSAFRIVTPRSTWCAVIIVVVYSQCLFVYPMAWFDLNYLWDKRYNRTIGYRDFSPLHTRDAVAVRVIEDMCVYSISVIPPSFTVAGCIVISVKVKLVSIQRKKMTSKEVSSNRTTKMLLAVCAVYTVTCAILTVPINVPVISYGPFSETHPSNIAIVMYQVMNIFICINSSCNFIIYVGLNKNFRKTYAELFNSNNARSGTNSLRRGLTVSKNLGEASSVMESQITVSSVAFREDDDDDM